MAYDSDAHALYRLARERAGTMAEGIRVIRRHFGLDLAQAKEIALQADAIADSLDAHQAALAPVLVAALDEMETECDGRADPSGTD
ncbi:MULTISPECIES: hypothetical protein [unclassified Lysobacter]|uniref:hypothetical protein n=1 Tax=unclassified Lysobacter TaxID=2635362 RepID=UPI001BE7C624|nr:MULTISPECIES: hypothetical protein [unclassified Lysobacter]MBT2749358.1 hypothetical protein [Lysobacter sp. ISL-42]MBT2778406.1 hypothetical protein [Lysobacter sp. ISL-54]MBT2783850.1 hypothetical protein [Lysobacter sp. ISL-52]